MQEDLGENAAALQSWQRALDVSLPLANKYPDNVPLRTTPVIHLAGIARGLVATDPTRRAQAIAALDQALESLRPFQATGRLDNEREGWIGWLGEERRKLLEAAP
ncbi:MAG: hypothetical protein U1E45_19720 [Geminicoccaceae bacterium]